MSTYTHVHTYTQQHAHPRTPMHTHARIHVCLHVCTQLKHPSTSFLLFLTCRGTVSYTYKYAYYTQRKTSDDTAQFHTPLILVKTSYLLTRAHLSAPTILSIMKCVCTHTPSHKRTPWHLRCEMGQALFEWETIMRSFRRLLFRFLSHLLPTLCSLVNLHFRFFLSSASLSFSLFLPFSAHSHHQLCVCFLTFVFVCLCIAALKFVYDCVLCNCVLVAASHVHSICFL